MRQYLFLLFAVVFILPVTALAQSSWVINTMAGAPDNPGYSGDGGPATIANLDNPSDIVFDASGNLYIADFLNNVVRKVDTFGNIYTIAGTGYGAGGMGDGSDTGDGGPATVATLNGPFALAIDSVGNIFIADGYNHVVRKVTVATGIITQIAGTHGALGYGGDGGPATNSSLDNPVGLAFDKAGNLYIADDHNHVVRKISVSDTITTFAGNHMVGYSGDGGQATAASLGNPIGLAVDTAGNVYIADTGNVVRKVNRLGIISTFAGTGIAGYSGDSGLATGAKLNDPERITVDDSNNVYISDLSNNVVRKVNPAGIISTFAGIGGAAGYAGDGGPAIAANLAGPEGVAINHLGYIFIADRGNDIIRFIGPPDTISNVGVVNVNNSNSSSLTIYPNPARSGYFTANLASTTREMVKITIVNVLGQTVKELNTATNKPVGIYLNQPAGIYFLSAATAHGKWNKQIAVE